MNNTAVSVEWSTVRRAIEDAKGHLRRMEFAATAQQVGQLEKHFEAMLDSMQQLNLAVWLIKEAAE